METIQCVKLSRPDSHGNKWVIYELKQCGAVAEEFDGADPGEMVQLELCEMTREEIDALPDFAGW